MFCVAFNTDENITGLAVSNALQLLLFTQWLARVASETNSTMASVSSVLHFTNHAPSEKAPIIIDSRPPADWPAHGEVFT